MRAESLGICVLGNRMYDGTARLGGLASSKAPEDVTRPSLTYDEVTKGVYSTAVSYHGYLGIYIWFCAAIDASPNQPSVQCNDTFLAPTGQQRDSGVRPAGYEPSVTASSGQES